VRALNGLKSAGASFRNHLASCLRHLGFTSSRGDADVWFQPAQKSNGKEYYEYRLVYTDDILAIGVDPKDILMKLTKYLKLKPDSIHPPDDYLGTKIKKTVLPNGASSWGQSSSHYVRNAVKNLEEWMVKEGRKLPKKLQCLARIRRKSMSTLSYLRKWLTSTIPRLCCDGSFKWVGLT
jgi:hypothetical protein